MTGKITSWRKARRSQEGEACVQVANTLTALGDTKNPGPKLAFGAQSSFTALTNAVKDGRLAGGESFTG